MKRRLVDNKGLILVAGILIGEIGSDGFVRYKHGLYQDAESVAVQKYGDCQYPLTEKEKSEWWTEMGNSHTYTADGRPNAVSLWTYLVKSE